MDDPTRPGRLEAAPRSAPSELSIEERLAQIERRTDSLITMARAGFYESWRRRLRPRLWTFKQYMTRRLRVPKRYAAERLPPDPPSIDIVTASYSQGRFIGATIDSVHAQHYPRLTYIVQDGVSTDGTLGVLRSYGERVYWRSEPDAGQGDAINRAFADCDGEIMAYLNSDDTLLPGTLAYVARAFHERPDIDIVYGHRIYIDEDGFEVGRCVLPPHDSKALKWADFVPQETMFWRRRVWDEIGPLDESFAFALDWDFLLRAEAAGFRLARLPRFLACFRVHEQQKSIGMMDLGEQEMRQLRSRYLGTAPGQYEIRRALVPYLVRQLFCDWMYRLGLFRY